MLISERHKKLQVCIVLNHIKASTVLLYNGIILFLPRLLGNNQVVTLMAEVLDNLVTGEIMQLNTANKNDIVSLDAYLKKTYYKTAALIANSSKSVAVLSG